MTNYSAREMGIARAREYDADLLRICNDAHNGTSFTPENRGYLYVNEFIDGMAADLKQAKTRIATAMKRGATVDAVDLEAWHACHVAESRSALVAWMVRKGNCVSAMIAGPSRFPAKRMQKKSDSADKAGQEYHEIRTRSINRIVAQALPYGDGRQVRSDDPGALDKLHAKLAAMERAHASMTEANRLIRKHDGDERLPHLLVASAGLTMEQAVEIIKPDAMGRRGFAGFSLTNNRANMVRVRQRIAELEKLGDAGEWAYEGDGWKACLDDGRVCIEFDERTSSDLYATLRGASWLWSRRNGRFQRKDTANARAAFEQRILPAIRAEMGS